MPASQVVPALYPKQRLGSQLGDGPPTAAFYQLELVGPEPSFGHVCDVRLPIRCRPQGPGVIFAENTGLVRYEAFVFQYCLVRASLASTRTRAML